MLCYSVLCMPSSSGCRGNNRTVDLERIWTSFVAMVTCCACRGVNVADGFGIECRRDV